MKNVVLIGFMGAGKSMVGRLLAYRLSKSFIDTDRKIEKEMGMPIPEIFAKLGEAAFRKKEEEVVARISRYKNAIIATGGGVVLNPRNMEALRQKGVIVSLAANPDVIMERTSRKPTRPLLQCENPRQVIADMLEKRQPLYEQADIKIDTSLVTPHEVTERIIEYLRQEGHLNAKSIR